MSSAIPMMGKRFGMLLVTERASEPRRARILWQCLCDCGTASIVDGRNLRNGHTTSCGCRRGNWRVKHGGARRGARLPEYKIWASMNQRCHNVNSPSFPAYGARGITVCDRWRNSFAAFLSDVGPKPAGDYSLERLDNSRGYSPENCIWGTRLTQAKNRRARAKRTHCIYGHDLEGRRLCETCRVLAVEAWKETNANHSM